MLESLEHLLYVCTFTDGALAFLEKMAKQLDLPYKMVEVISASCHEPEVGGEKGSGPLEKSQR